MSVFRQAADAWGMETAGAEGHYAELERLHAAAPDAVNLAYGMWGSLPCVLGTDGGRLVVASAKRDGRAGPPASAERSGSSFVVSAGNVTVRHVGKRQAAAIVAAVNVSGS